jgi:phage repressor protein C with HTH and peptisase S24 domain
MDDVRQTLDRLIRERGDDYLSISRLLNRNAAYVQQFIRRGTPRKLDEADRRLLARYFGVDEVVLGALDNGGRSPKSKLRLVARYALGASAGPGSLNEDEAAMGQIAFDPKWLRSLGVSVTALSMIRVAGDSMMPTLSDGDEIMVDRDDGAERIRDGIYVLRMDDALIVKRIAPNPATRRFAIRSDNPAYPEWPDCDPAAITVIGRVIWAGRKL